MVAVILMFAGFFYMMFWAMFIAPYDTSGLNHPVALSSGALFALSALATYCGV